MIKHALVAVAGIALMGLGYTAVAGTGMGSMGLGDGCDKCSAAMAATTSAPATAAAPAKVDVHNTKCIVRTDDDVEGDGIVEYQGKVYHICCPSCIKSFNKDPEKYVKAFDADPAKYGVKK